jgi:AcrR family transcriptional regulator
VNQMPPKDKPKARHTSPRISEYALPPNDDGHQHVLGDNQPRSRKERNRREIFDRLMAATYRLMFSRPLDEATVQEITDLADLGKGTFFNYFSTKEEVVPEIMRDEVRQLAQIIDRIKAGQLSARQALLESFTKQVWHELPEGDWLTFYGSRLRAVARTPAIRKEVSESMEVARRQFQLLVAIGQKRGEFRTDHTAATLGTYIHQWILGVTLISWIKGKKGLAANDPHLRLLLDSLSHDPSERTQKRSVTTSGTGRTRRGR